jgi:hypothetical protein
MIYIALQLKETPVIIEEITGLHSENAQELMDELNEVLENLIVPETRYLTVISEHMFTNYSLASWKIVGLCGEEGIFRMEFNLPSPSGKPVVEEPIVRVSRFDREDVI